MARDLTADMVTAFSEKVVTPVYLAELFFESQTIRMWSGYGTLNWADNEYLGGGHFIGVSPIDETQDIQAKGIICSLNGVSSTLISASLSERVRGRPFRLYIASVSTDTIAPNQGGGVVNTEDGGIVNTEDGGVVLLENNLVDTPYRIFSGLMDVIEYIDNGETANIRLSVENILIIGQRQKISRYTNEDQRKKYPNDAGLSFINQLQDKEIVW